MANFDPDAYLSGGGGNTFDPDAYLKSGTATSTPAPSPAVGTAVVGGPNSGFEGQVMRGVTFGGSDMLAGATDATLDKLADFLDGKSGTSWHDYYDAELARSRAQGDQYQKDHPFLSGAAQVTGSLAALNPEAAATGAVKTVGGLMKTAMTSAGYGAALGGAQGFISGRGGFENRAEDAGVGALAGGVLGAATPALFAGGRALYNGARTAIGGAIPDSTVNSTLGSAISSLGDAEGDASPQMLARLQAARTQASQVWNNTMQAAGVDETTPIATGDLKTAVKNYMGGLTRAERSEIPSTVTGILDDFGANEPLKEIQDWRSKIGTTAQQAGASPGGWNAARILRGLGDHVEDFVSDIPLKQGTLSQDQVDAYETARQGWRQFKQTFSGQGSPVTTALSSREFGNAAESNTANLFIRKGAGAPEALNSYLNAVGNDPQGLQAARDAFTQKFMDAVSTGQDASGAQTYSPKAISKFLDDYSHVTDSNLFTDDQRALMDRMGDVADASRTPSGPRRFVDQVVSKLAPAAAGYAGFHVGGIPGMAAGATLGTGANRIMEALENAPRDAAVRLLAASVNDPTLAKTMLTPSAATGKIPLGVQAKIYGLLAGRGAMGLASQLAPQGQ